MKILPLSEVKMRLSQLVDEVWNRDVEILVTKNGKPAAIILNPDEYESWQETLAIRNQPELRQSIKRGLRQLRRTKATYTVDELLPNDESE